MMAQGDYLRVDPNAELKQLRAERERHVREKVELAGMVAGLRDEIERLKAGWKTAAKIGMSEQEQNKKWRAENEQLKDLIDAHHRMFEPVRVDRDLWKMRAQKAEEILMAERRVIPGTNIPDAETPSY
jgi:hypothetical protein